jgi:hypothetical protein
VPWKNAAIKCTSPFPSHHRPKLPRILCFGRSFIEKPGRQRCVADRLAGRNGLWSICRKSNSVADCRNSVSGASAKYAEQFSAVSRISQFKLVDQQRRGPRVYAGPPHARSRLGRLKSGKELEVGSGGTKICQPGRISCRIVAFPFFQCKNAARLRFSGSRIVSTSTPVSRWPCGKLAVTTVRLKSSSSMEMEEMRLER